MSTALCLEQSILLFINIELSVCSLLKKFPALEIQVSFLTDKFLIYSIIFCKIYEYFGFKISAGTDISAVRFHYSHFLN